MGKKTVLLCLSVASVTACVFFSVATDKYAPVHNVLALLPRTSNLSAFVLFQSRDISNQTVNDITAGNSPPVLTPSEDTESIGPKPISNTYQRTQNPLDPVRFKANIEYQEKLRKRGLESTELHDFKSTYIVDPVIYDNAASHKVPGKRKTKIISCLNCPLWFSSNYNGPGYNRDFRKCPYSECLFDPNGVMQNKADLVFFFPTPSKLPFRPPGQIWTYCSWESPVHYGYPSNYSKWSNVFNWTMSFRQDADIFAPNNQFAWRAREHLMNYSQYLKIAMSKTKTAAWFVSNCRTQSRRLEYVKRMQKIIDIDIFGSCTKRKCAKRSIDCLKKLNDTYKFYLSFENSFCKDYVTEKFFRNFDHRLQVIPVARGGFDYQKHIPPNMIVDASRFNSPEALAKHLKELGDDLLRYTAMLKEKDKLTVLNWKNDWCDLCERLHKGGQPKTMKDIKQVTHYDGVCTRPKL